MGTVHSNRIHFDPICVALTTFGADGGAIENHMSIKIKNDKKKLRIKNESLNETKRHECSLSI